MIHKKREPDRKPDPRPPGNFMDEAECQYRFACIVIFPKCPAQLLELWEPDTGQKTRPWKTESFYGWIVMSMQIYMHWFFFDRTNHHKDIEPLSHTLMKKRHLNNEKETLKWKGRRTPTLWRETLKIKILLSGSGFRKIFDFKMIQNRILRGAFDIEFVSKTSPFPKGPHRPRVTICL